MFVSNGPIAQLVERAANNGKVLCSRLTRTRFRFLLALLFLFSQIAYIHCIKIVNLFYKAFVSNGPVAQLVECGANNGKVLCSRLKRTRFRFLFALLFLFS